MTTQTIAFNQDVAWQQAYKFLTQGIRAKLSRDVNGVWTCTEVLTEVLEVVR